MVLLYPRNISHHDFSHHPVIQGFRPPTLNTTSEPLTANFLEETNHPEDATAVSITFIVLTTVVYAIFIASRYFYAKRNFWELWILYPFSYLCCVVLCVLCFCKLQTHVPLI